MKEPTIHSIIFGFGHKARSGKDTAAAWIKLNRGKSPLVFDGYDIRIYSFAQELKREVNENAMKSGGMLKLFDDGLRMEDAGFLQENGNILALPDWVQYDWNAPMDDPDCPYGKQRSLLQWWGTELRRSVNPEYWVNKVAQRIAEEKPEIALITDVRFPNEVVFVQKYGEAIKCHRPTPKEAFVEASVQHPSETALDNFTGWDDVIINDGTLEEFRNAVLFSFDSLMTTIPSVRSDLGELKCTNS